jgi:hypothetical protein
MTTRVVEVSFKGEASGALLEEFDCLAIATDRGVTRLRVMNDAAVVHGILEQISGLGLELIGLREVDDETSTSN